MRESMVYLRYLLEKLISLTYVTFDSDFVININELVIYKRK